MRVLISFFGARYEPTLRTEHLQQMNSKVSPTSSTKALWIILYTDVMSCIPVGIGNPISMEKQS